LSARADTSVCNTSKPTCEHIHGVRIEDSNQLVKGSGPEVFLIQNGTRRWITDSKSFDAYGFKFRDVKEIFDSELNKYPMGTPISNDGTLLKGSGSQIYMIVDGTRRLIPARVSDKYQLYSKKVHRVSDRNLFSIPEGVAFR
jgi:hypothetical protein